MAAQVGDHHEFGAIDVEQRVAVVSALVALLSETPNMRLPLRSLVERVRSAQEAQPAGVPGPLGALRDVPVFFSVRGGWTSPAVTAGVNDGCAMNLLRVAPGGLVEVKADESWPSTPAASTGVAPSGVTR